MNSKPWIRKGLILLIGSCLFISGCAFKDIDKRLFVLAIGIDKTDDKEKPFNVTLSLEIPSGSLKDKPPKYVNISRKSSSLANAIHLLRSHVDKELDFGHTRVTILSEDILDEDLDKVLDFLIRRRDIQMVSWVAVGKPSAKAVLDTRPSYEMVPTNTLPNFFSDTGTESDYVIPTFLFELRRELLETGIDPVLPIVEAKDKRLVVNQSIVSPSSEKKVYLNSNETKKVKLLKKKGEKLEIHVKEKDHHFTTFIDHSRVKYKIHTPAKGPPKLKMDIRLVGIIEESIETLYPNRLNAYNQMVSKKVKKDVLHLLNKLQEENIDPLGFGIRYKATRFHNRDTYAEWKKLYPDIQFDVSVSTEIKSTGTIQ